MHTIRNPAIRIARRLLVEYISREPPYKSQEDVKVNGVVTKTVLSIDITIITQSVTFGMLQIMFAGNKLRMQLQIFTKILLTESISLMQNRMQFNKMYKT